MLGESDMDLLSIEDDSIQVVDSSLGMLWFLKLDECRVPLVIKDLHSYHISIHT